MTCSAQSPPMGPMPSEAIGDVFLGICGYPPRTADLQLLEMLGKAPEDVAEFIWDHHLGEPDDPTQEQVLHACRLASARHGGT